MDAEPRRALQVLAREELKLRVLQDVLIDIQVCRLEGRDPMEFARELVALIKGVVESCGY
jgi:hypothetical protein